jgi:hypothetical protein
LPNSKAPKPTPPFAIGAKVVLRSCPHAPPGVVQGMKRRRILVRWDDLGYVGRHQADALMLVENSEARK